MKSEVDKSFGLRAHHDLALLTEAQVEEFVTHLASIQAIASGYSQLEKDDWIPQNLGRLARHEADKYAVSKRLAMNVPDMLKITDKLRQRYTIST